MTELIPRLPLDQIGGGRVFRPCTIAGQHRPVGTVLSGEDLMKVAPVNLRALIDQRFLQVWRKPPEEASTLLDEGEVMVVPRLGSSNRFDVVVGKRLNGAAPLSKSEAEALAKRASVARKKAEEPAAA